ncbi:hypothetical protein BT69DRAFT_1292364 [Atractiella rhizophila]|nr:hypothetical protein BT69DRAFT_1292364 [Atractiella rhizophila]
MDHVNGLDTIKYQNWWRTIQIGSLSLGTLDDFYRQRGPVPQLQVSFDGLTSLGGNRPAKENQPQRPVVPQIEDGRRRAKLEKTQACRRDAQRRSVELDKWANVDKILSKDDQGTYLISADAPYLHFRASLFEEQKEVLVPTEICWCLERKQYLRTETMSQFFIDFATSVLRHVRRSLYQCNGINPDQMAEVRYDRMLIKGEHQMGVYESRELQELKPRFRAMVQHLEPCWSAVVRKLEEHFPEQTESMRDLWDNVPGTVGGLGLSGIFTGVVLNYGVSTCLLCGQKGS